MTDTTDTTDLPTINAELFGKVRDVIDADPERHDQRDWQNCAGGIAIQEASGESTTHEGMAKLAADPAYPQIRAVCCDSCGLSEGDTARILLGLTEDEAYGLFHRSKNAEARWLVGQLADGATRDTVSGWYEYARELTSATVKAEVAAYTAAADKT